MGREGEKYQCVVASCTPPLHTTTEACALIRNPTWDPLVCRLVLNPLLHSSQGHWFILVCALTGDGIHNLGE